MYVIIIIIHNNMIISLLLLMFFLFLFLYLISGITFIMVPIALIPLIIIFMLLTLIEKITQQFGSKKQESKYRPKDFD